MASFIDTVIPIAILIVGLYILYRPLKGPLSGLWSLIGGVFEKIRDRNSGVKNETIRTIQYE